jgi:hypothetical protein
VDPLAEQLKRELQALGPNHAMSETVEAWPSAVGAEIARNAWPARFQRDGTLIVHVKDAIWGFELGHRSSQIAERLPGRPPLKFVPGPLPEPGPGEAAVREPPAATLEERRQAAEWASSIEDETLRRAVAKAAAASLASRPDDRRF